MDAVIYTESDSEFDTLAAILLEENFAAARDPLDEHGHYEYAYDIAVVALEGARGMEIVRNWAERFRQTRIIWITGDPYFAGMAMEQRVHDFITRPYTPDRFRDAVRRARPMCSDTRLWSFDQTK